MSIACKVLPSSEETLRAELDRSTQWLLLVADEQRNTDQGFTVDHSMTFDLDRTGAVVFAEIMIRSDRWIVDPDCAAPTATIGFSRLVVEVPEAEDLETSVECRTNVERSIIRVSFVAAKDGPDRFFRLSRNLHALVRDATLVGFVADLR
jgi:hypothetical protein